MRIVALLLALFISSTAFPQTAADPFSGGSQSNSVEFLPVEEAYQLGLDVIDDQTLRLFWQIAPEYYLYQSRFKFQLSDEQGEIGRAHV